MLAFIELHREVAQPGGEEGAPVHALGQLQAGHLGEIVDLPVDVRRLESGVSEAPGLDHE